jgi:hypothetical protein
MHPLQALVHNNSRRILVTAHPDDESLWFAGLLLRYPGPWTVVCCSIPQKDPIRAYTFYDACAWLGARGRVLPWVENKDQPLALCALETLDLEGYDLVVTHGRNGEYGQAPT